MIYHVCNNSVVFWMYHKFLQMSTYPQTRHYCTTVYLTSLMILGCILLCNELPWLFSCRSDDVAHDGARFCEIHSIGGKRFIFTLCKDLKIRIWSCQVKLCSLYSLFQFLSPYHFHIPVSPYLSLPLLLSSLSALPIIPYLSQSLSTLSIYPMSPISHTLPFSETIFCNLHRWLSYIINSIFSHWNV